MTTKLHKMYKAKFIGRKNFMAVNTNRNQFLNRIEGKFNSTSMKITADLVSNMLLEDAASSMLMLLKEAFTGRWTPVEF